MEKMSGNGKMAANGKAAAERKAALKPFYVLSGEGERGTWRKVWSTRRGIKSLLKRERCGGDRWAHAYGDECFTETGDLVGCDVETGEYRLVSEFGED